MPIRVECPKCEAVLNAPDAAAGKMVNCPKCSAGVKMPSDDPGFEVVEPRKRPPLDDEPVSRPRRRREEDDDNDDRPRRPRRRHDVDEESTIPIAYIVGGSVLAGVLILVGGLWAGGVFKGKDSDKKDEAKEKQPREIPEATGQPERPQRPDRPNRPQPAKKPYTKGAPPGGYSLADGDRFACFLPGTARVMFPLSGMAQEDHQNYEQWGNFDTDEFKITAYEFNSQPVGNTQSALLKIFEDLKIDINWKAAWNINHQQKMQTAAGGMPCLMITYEKDLKFAGGTADADSKANQDFHTVVIMTRGKRVYVLQAHTRGRAVSEAELKTILDSFMER